MSSTRDPYSFLVCSIRTGRPVWTIQVPHHIPELLTDFTFTPWTNACDSVHRKWHAAAITIAYWIIIIYRSSPPVSRTHSIRETNVRSLCAQFQVGLSREWPIGAAQDIASPDATRRAVSTARPTQMLVGQPSVSHAGRNVQQWTKAALGIGPVTVQPLPGSRLQRWRRRGSSIGDRRRSTRLASLHFVAGTRDEGWGCACHADAGPMGTVHRPRCDSDRPAKVSLFFCNATYFY